MKTKTKKITMLLAFVLTLCLFSFGQTVSAQSTNNCMKVKGNRVDIGGWVTTGTVTNAGILNGTQETIYDPASFMFTADPTTATFTGNTTLVANRGVLRTRGVYMIDLASLYANALLRIDPNASEGIFRGATGVLYADAKVIDPLTVVSDLSGEICFANQ